MKRLKIKWILLSISILMCFATVIILISKRNDGESPQQNVFSKNISETITEDGNGEVAGTKSIEDSKKQEETIEPESKDKITQVLIKESETEEIDPAISQDSRVETKTPLQNNTTPKQEPKCSEETIAEYNTQIIKLKDLKDYYIESAEKIFLEENSKCEEGYISCVKKIPQALEEYDRSHPSCYMARACLRDRDYLEEDLNTVCENSQDTCIKTAETKKNNNSWVINTTKDLTKYESLLAGCL